MSKISLLRGIRNLKIVYKKSVNLRSGIKSNYYCDVKKIYGYPKLVSVLAREVAKHIDIRKTTCVAASGYGGIPLGALVSLKSGLPFVLVRDLPKGHGKKTLLDGYVPTKKDKVTIIDDVLTTGSSIKKTLSIIKKSGATVSEAIVVVKRKEVSLLIPIRYLFTAGQLL